MTFQPGNQAYLAMLKASRAVVENVHGRPELRLSILADHATQQFAQVLRAALLELGFFPIVHEADYSTAAQEAYDPTSELHRAKSHFVFLSSAMQKYRDRFFSTNDAAGRAGLPAAYLTEVLGIADALADSGHEVIVSNFALPLERGFGNYSTLTPNSLYGSVLKFNQLLAEALVERKAAHLNDVAYISARFGTEAFLDERLWIGSKYLCANSYLPEVGRSVARVVAARKGKVTKCVVLDLDNTLWGGVIGDDGLDGIALGGDAYGESFQLFQKYLLSLRDRGYILAVCSKNNEDLAMEAFRSHPEMILKETDIAVFAVNWNTKSSNIEYISRVLNIGLDSLIFIDDSAYERNEVRTALPMVAVPEMTDDPSDYIRTLEASGLLEATGESADDLTRNQKYREEAQRATAQIKYTNIDDYLQSLAMIMEVGPFRAEQLPRVAQLIQRSNQFNLRTQRLSEASCERYMKDDSSKLTVAARLKDRFGDYGLICAICCDIDGGLLKIAELVMSCRVLKRGVEEHLMNYLFRACRARGLKGIQGEWIATAKNAMVKDFFKGFGFDCIESASGREVWYLDADRYNERRTQINEVAA